MTAKLIAKEGTLKGLVLELSHGEEWIIGRDPEECQLLVEDPSASRKHLICRKTPVGILVENLSDTNPLQVNNVPVEEPLMLRDGDELRIGDGLFDYHADDEEENNELSEIEEANEEVPPHEEVAENEIPGREDISADDISDKPIESTIMPQKSSQKPVDDEKHDTLFEEEVEEGYPAHQIAEIHFDLTDSGRWLLKVVAGPNNGAEFSMKAGTSYVIGNEPSTCDIILQDISVSRQHLRLSISEDEKIYVEDLGSSNGTIIDQQKITQKTELAPNTLVSLGTTTIAIIDTEGERHTIISPLLPSIANILKQQEEKKTPLETNVPPETEAPPMLEPEPLPLPVEPPASATAGNLVFISIITGILLIGTIGISLLFQTNEVTTPKVDMQKEIHDALVNFPGVKFTFNSTTGRLFLGGHVMTTVDRNQVLYNLQSFTPKYIKSLDNNIIVDDFIWQEFNQIISKNPGWKGVNIHAPSPGKFVLSGYLKTRQQADSLADYMGQNFPYVNLLESQVTVEEDLANQINQMLQEGGLRDVHINIANGEISLTGNIATIQTSIYNDILKQIKTIRGVRTVKNYVTALQVEEVEVDISNKYTVTGSSRSGDKISVMINGNILSEGDYLEGMKIINITPSSVFLQKGDIKYRIDY